MDSRTTFFGILNQISMRRFEGDYDIGRKCIARGDQCEIMQVTDRRNQEPRTVKVYRKMDMDEQMRALIMREIEILARLDHPNITKVHAVYEDEFKLYIVVDPVRGPSLFEKIIKAGQLTELDSAMIIQRVLSIVRYLHSNGYVHRNLRPETLIFENDTTLYDLKLLDLLSIAETVPEAHYSTIEQDLSYDKVVKGGQFYFMAPELLRGGDRQYGFKCDMWSCGVLLYNMLTGILPFFEHNESLTKMQIRSGQFSI